MVPIEVLMFVPSRVAITVPSLRVTMTVAPPSVVEPSVQVISQEDNIKDIIHMDILESDKVQ